MTNLHWIKTSVVSKNKQSIMFDDVIDDFEPRGQQQHWRIEDHDDFTFDEKESSYQRKNIQVKAIIIGGKNVGKTTIANALFHFEKFNDFESMGSSGRSHVPQFESTFVADVFRKTLPAPVVFSTMAYDRQPLDGNPYIFRSDKVEIALWDTAGYELHDTFPPSILLNGSDVVLLCFSIDDVSSLNVIRKLLDHCKKSNVSDHCVYFVMGNKLDVYGELCKNVISSKTLRKEGRSKSIKGYPFVFGKHHHVMSVFDSFVDDPCYKEAEELFFSSGVSNELIEVQRILLDSIDDHVNENKFQTVDNLKTSTEHKKRNRDLLFSYTTVFCSQAHTQNPLYCLLYAVAVHLEKRTGYNKYKHALMGCSKFDGHRKNDAEPLGVSLETRGRSPNASSNIHLNESTSMMDVTRNNNNNNKYDRCCT